MEKKFRISVLGKPKSPWRGSYEEALADAVALELASWDASRREWFLAVPVDMEKRRTARTVSVATERLKHPAGVGI